MASPAFLILAGEVSGDRYGAKLADSLRHQNPQTRILGLGGDAMAASGVELIDHIRDFSSMGFSEVFRHIVKLRRLQNDILALIRKKHVDAVVCVDFPDFNLSLARRIRKVRGIRQPGLFYFVPPQVWIWRASRVHLLRDLFDGVFPIFEFEHQLLLKNNVPSRFFGHPMRDFLTRPEYPQNAYENQDTRQIALLPGSRIQEVERILPVMLSSVKDFFNRSQRPMKIEVGSTGTIPDSLYQTIIHKSHLPDGISVRLSGAIQEIILRSDLVLSKSGTVNLEIAYASKPAIVIYRTSWLTYGIARLLVETRFISLINILSAKGIVREFIQHHAAPSAIASEMERIFSDSDYRRSMTGSMSALSESIFAKHQPGVHDSIAGVILRSLVQSSQ